MKFFRLNSDGLSRWFHQTRVGRLSRVVPLGWLIPLFLIATPLIILFVLLLFLFLLFLSVFGLVFYLATLRSRLRARRDNKVIEVEYWVKEDKE